MPHSNAVTSLKNFIQWRYVFVFVAFLGNVNLYVMRSNLSVALVAMVNQTFVKNRDYVNGTVTSEDCLQYISANSSGDNILHSAGDFNWEPKLQGVILGAFYYGYILTQLPGGILAKECSAKIVFGLGVFIPSLLAGITPFAAHQGPYWLVGVRVLQGFAEGVTVPALNSIIVKWMPQSELTRAVGLIGAGYIVGTVLSLVCSGLICAAPSLGWPVVFYISGASGVVWFILWLFLVSDSPHLHPLISDSERHHIRNLQCMSVAKHPRPVPWRQVLISRAVLPYYFTCVMNPFVFNIGLAGYPTYLSEVLHFDVDESGVLSAAPFLAALVSLVGASFFVDNILRKRQIVSLTWSRKLMQFFGQTTCVIAIICVAPVGCYRHAAVALLILSSMGGALTSLGYDITPCDIAPNYVSVIYGIGNTLCSIPGIIGPVIMGLLTNEDQSLDQWFKVFIIGGALSYSGTIVYCLFSTSRLQWWNDGGDVIRSIQEDLGGGRSGYLEWSTEDETRRLLDPQELEEED